AGTPEFAAAVLAAIHAAGFPVPLVLTQPDRPAGRGMKLTASPVKRLALEHGFAVAQPTSLRRAGKYPQEAAQAIDLLRATPHDRLARMGAELIVAALRDLERDGALPSTPQPEEGETYAEKIAKHEAALDWRRPAEELARQIRAFDPFPGAFGMLDNAAI